MLTKSNCLTHERKINHGAKVNVPSRLSGLKETSDQSCQMVSFQTKNSALGKLWCLENVDIFYGYLEYFKDI
jgi:hypothetical protein